MSVGRSLFRKIDRERAQELIAPEPDPMSRLRGGVKVTHNDDDSVTIQLGFIDGLGLYKLVLGILTDDDEDADIVPRLQVPLSYIYD